MPWERNYVALLIFLLIIKNKKIKNKFKIHNGDLMSISRRRQQQKKVYRAIYADVVYTSIYCMTIGESRGVASQAQEFFQHTVYI